MAIIGWLGAILLGVCSFPEAILALQTGDSGLSFMFLGMWGTGEILALIYTIYKNTKVKLIPLLFNYGVNIILISIILVIKILAISA